jgi:hypothetical protein
MTIHLDSTEQCRTAAGYVSSLEAKLASGEFLSWDEQLLLAALARDALTIAAAAHDARESADDADGWQGERSGGPVPAWLKTLQEK